MNSTPIEATGYEFYACIQQGGIKITDVGEENIYFVTSLGTPAYYKAETDREIVLAAAILNQDVEV